MSIAKKAVLGVVVALAVALSATVSYAVVVTPGDAAVAVSPAFGAMAVGGQAIDQYKAFGIMFSDGGVPTAIFSDPPLAFAGVNGQGNVDLLSPVNGHFVVPSTTTLATTNFLSVEAGHAAVGSLLLQVYDISHNLLGSTINDDGTGLHGRTLLTLDYAGMAYFSVSGNDSWGMNQIEFNTPGGGPVVPEPASLSLLGFGLLGLLGLKRKK